MNEPITPTLRPELVMAIPAATVPQKREIQWRFGLAWAMGAVVCFHLAYSSPVLCWCILGYLFCLLQLARMPTGRQAFYFGLGVGFLTAAPQLSCFWVIFGPAAAALWL